MFVSEEFIIRCVRDIAFLTICDIHYWLTPKWTTITVHWHWRVQKWTITNMATLDYATRSLTLILTHIWD